MQEETIRSILRLLAVVTMLVGVSLASATLVSLVGASSAAAAPGLQVQVTGMVAEMGFYAVLSYAVVAAWGLVLYLLSEKLAAKIAE